MSFTKAFSTLFISLFLTFVLSSCSANTFKVAVEGITGGGSSTESTDPRIVFTDDISQAPVQSDTVTIEVRNFPNGIASTYQYVLIANTDPCDATTDFSSATTFTSSTAIADSPFINENNNGKYICAKAKDSDGITLYQKSAYPLNIDVTAPTATIANAPTATNNTTTLDVTIAGTTPSNVDVTHYKYKVGEQSSTTCSDSTGYSTTETTVATKITNDISSLSDGGIRLCVVGRDQAGNWQTYTSATAANWTKDTTPPSHPVTLSGTPLDPSYDTALNVTVSGTDVTHYRFKVGSKTSTDCSLATDYSSEAVVANNITSAIGATGDKRLCVVARDAAGNWQDFANATVYEWTRVDTLTVTINQSIASPEQKDPINTLPIVFDVVFNLPIDTSTLTTSDITQDTTASGASSAVTWELTTAGGDTNLTTGNGKNFKLKAVTGTSTGKIIPFIAANKVDFANSSSLKNSASTSTDNMVEYTLVKPNVTINQASGQNDPTNALPIVFDVVFDKEINTATFDINDITKNGNTSAITWELTTAGGSTDLTTGDKKTFKLKATATTASAATGNTLQPSIVANVVQSLAGNGNNASSATDNTVVLDTTAPTGVTLSQTPHNNSNPTNLDVVIASLSGEAATYYQYVLTTATTCPSSGYSSDQAIAQKIQDSLASYNHGDEIRLCVKGKDDAGNLQTTATSYTWTKNTLDPSVTATNVPTGTNNTTSFTASISRANTVTTRFKYKVLDKDDTDTCHVTTSGYGSEVAIGSSAESLTIDLTSPTRVDGTIRLCLLGGSSSAWSTTPMVYTWVKDTTPPTITSAETMDKDHNGKIDGYKIVFSEAVDDSTFIAANWNVNAHPNRTLNTSFTGDTADDETIYISFDENSADCSFTNQDGCDTGSKPDLTMMTAGGLKDIYGNNIALVQSATVAEADKAVPVLIGAQAASQLRVRAVFSENVKASSAECGTGSSQPTVNCSTLYGITAGLTVSKAVLENGSTSGNKVMLTTSQQTYNTGYTLTATVGKVKDVNNNAVITGSNTATFTGAAPALVLVSAEAVNNTTVKIVFNESLNTGDTQTTLPTNYLIGGLTVTGVVVDPSDATNKTLLLSTSSQTSDTSNGYTITVVGNTVPAQNGTSGTCNAPNNTATFTGDKLPEVVSVASINATTVFVTFSEDVKFTTGTEGALHAGNYNINNGLTASTPVSQTANTIVKLTTTHQTSGNDYRLTVTNVQDLNGNIINPILNYGNFVGQEKLKLLSARYVIGSSNSFGIFRMTFSKPFTYSVNGSGTNAADNLNNWDFPFPSGSTTVVCTSSDDSACPNGYTQGTDTEIFFKVTPKPPIGAYTIVAATAANSPTGAAGCITTAGGSAPASCLKPNPNDRAAVAWDLPTIIEEGAVYNDPFNDNITFSGQVVKYNGKLLIGPNATDSGLFMTDINMHNATNIVLDSNKDTPGIQTFQDNPTGDRVYEHGTTPLAGIDYMYAACDKGEPTLSGTDCTAVGGIERLYIVGFLTQGGGYRSVWITDDKVSPFSFKHVTGLSAHLTRTFRAMNLRMFKGQMYQVQQHQKGKYVPRASRYTPDGTIYSPNDLAWRFIDRIGALGTKKNGQHDAYLRPPPKPPWTQLVSIDYMYEYDNDGTGANVSQLYLANGGSCITSDLTNHSRTHSDIDGGIVRSVLAHSTVANPPKECADPSDCMTKWEDITPGADLGSGTSATLASNQAAYIWNHYMSKALPQDPTNDDNANDWNHLVPANTIAPSIKAIPKMVEFNGDLYAIRNACANVTVEKLSSTVHDTCPAGEERPQLWRLPKNCGTATQCAQAWQFIGNTTSTTAAIKYTTRMGDAEWIDGTDQADKTAKNKYITLLEKVDDRLYVGFDNEDGINIWRTKSGVTTPTSEADFEAVCQTGNECFQSSKQFGMTTSATTTDIKIFDSLAVNDAGKDYLIFNARSGSDPLRIYRQGNN